MMKIGIRKHARTEVNNDPDNVGPAGVEIKDGKAAGTESKEAHEIMQASSKEVDVGCAPVTTPTMIKATNQKTSKTKHEKTYHEALFV